MVKTNPIVNKIKEEKLCIAIAAVMTVNVNQLTQAVQYNLSHTVKEEKGVTSLVGIHNNL